MALKGTLSDIGIIDLIQFPHVGRRTGQLVVTDGDQEGRLFYDKGSLVHACFGDTEGMEALVNMVAWTDGAFEFLNSSEPTRKTVDMDLHRAVMQALKLHDERKEEEERLKAEGAIENTEGDALLSSLLTEFVSSTEFALHASLTSPDGSLKAVAEGMDGPPEGIAKLRASLYALLNSYPRGTLNKVFIVDDYGTVIMMRLPSGTALIVTASKDASLGSVSMGVGRLAERLE